MGRLCFVMEIDMLYPSTLLRAVSPSNRCDVIVQRWEQFTGKKAERHAAGQEVRDAQG